MIINAVLTYQLTDYESYDQVIIIVSCKESKNLTLKMAANLTQIDKLKKKKLKWIKLEKILKMHPFFLSELLFHTHDWLIISFEDFCIVTIVSRKFKMTNFFCCLV